MFCPPLSYDRRAGNLLVVRGGSKQSCEPPYPQQLLDSTSTGGIEMKESVLLFVNLVMCSGIFSVEAFAQRTGYTSETVSLKVSIDPVPENGACAVCSDNLGEYIDGVDGVSATFTKYGHSDFYFRGGDASPRRVWFYYSVQYPSTNHPFGTSPPAAHTPMENSSPKLRQSL